MAKFVPIDKLEQNVCGREGGEELMRNEEPDVRVQPEYKKSNRHGAGCGVICTRFELVTSCLSSKRSKPTELADLFFRSKIECKSTHILRIGKIFLKKSVILQSERIVCLLLLC